MRGGTQKGVSAPERRVHWHEREGEGVREGTR